MVELFAGAANELVDRAQHGLNGLLVPDFDGVLAVDVEFVDPGTDAVVDLPLALAHQPNDHEAAPSDGGSACVGGALP